MKNIIQDTLKLFATNISSIIQLALPFALLIALVERAYFLFENKLFTYTLLGLETIIYSVFLPAFILLLAQSWQNSRWTTKEYVLNGITYAPYLLIVYLIIYVPFYLTIKITSELNISGFIYAVATALFIYVSIKSSFTSYLIVLEEDKPIDSIKNSFKFTTGKAFKIIAALLIFGGPLAILKTILSVAVNQTPNSNFIFEICISVFFTIAYSIIHAGLFTIYCLDYFQRKKSIQ